MVHIEGPDRGQRLAGISTSGARHALPTRRICRNRRGRIKRDCKIRPEPRAREFIWIFFRCRHENGSCQWWASTCTMSLQCVVRVNKQTYKTQRFLWHIISSCNDEATFFYTIPHSTLKFRSWLSKLKRKLIIIFVSREDHKQLQFHYGKMSPVNYVFFWLDSVYPSFGETGAHTGFLATYISRFWVAVIFKLPT